MKTLLLALLFAQNQSLFDGKTLAGWRPAGASWAVEDGAIKSVPKVGFREDLLSVEEYEDFELEFEWKISPGGNSGVKYRLQEAVFLNESIARPGIKKFEDVVKDEIVNRRSSRDKLKPGDRGQVYTVAFEFQLIDDANYKDGVKPNQTTGSLYSFLPAEKRVAKAPGSWNTAKLVVRGDRFEHWINWTQVLAGSLKSPAIAAGAGKRWGTDHPVYDWLVKQPKTKSPILLQNHGDAAWFRNLRIKRL
jgi:hypothetical protein